LGQLQEERAVVRVGLSKSKLSCR